VNRTHFVLASLLLVAACGNKDKVNCELYASAVVKLGSPDLSESRISSVKLVAREACEKGDVTAAEARCVIGASSHDEALRCHGLGGSSEATTTPPPTPPSSLPRARSEGFSVGIPKGWTKGDATGPTLWLNRDEEHSALIARFKKKDMPGATSNMLASDDACRTAATPTDPSVHATLDSAKLVDTRLGKSCQSRMRVATAKIWGNTFAVGSDEMIAVTCMYTDAEPPPACAEILDSIAVE
jgi:hypothetical protein